MKVNIKRKELAALMILLACILAFSVLYYWQRQKPVAGLKEISIYVVHGDESENFFQFQTEALYLGELLQAEELVAGNQSPYGLFIVTADGETAREEYQEWWCITKAGELVMDGSDTIVLTDGDIYELTLMKGY